MNKLYGLALVVALILPQGVQAATHVRGYVRHSTGRYVAPHYQSHRDHSRLNNYSTKGNVNPFTGKIGSKSSIKPR